jgi:hypothetical protein
LRPSAGVEYQQRRARAGSAVRPTAALARPGDRPGPPVRVTSTAAAISVGRLTATDVRTARKLCTHNLAPRPAPGGEVRALPSWPGARSALCRHAALPEVQPRAHGRSRVVTLIGNLVRVVIFDIVATLVFLVVGTFVLDTTILGVWLVARLRAMSLLKWLMTIAIVSGVLVTWWALFS